MNESKYLKEEPRIRLKLCPFCGGEARMRTFRTYNESACGIREKYYVECCACGAQAPRTSFNQEEAAEAWNDRLDNRQ